MLHIRPTQKRRSAAFLLLLLMLFSCLAPCAAAEEEVPDTEAVSEAGDPFRAEPVSLITDDKLSCTSGYLIYCDNPEQLSLLLFADVRRTVRNGDVLSAGESVLSDEARSWIAVRTLSADPEASGETTDLEQPAFIVEFRDPGDGSPCPEFLRSVSVEGASLYVLSPAYTAVFQAGAAETEGGSYTAITGPLECCPENDTFLFELERPQRFAVRLKQELDPIAPSADAEEEPAAENTPAETPEETEEASGEPLMVSSYKVRSDSALSLYCYLPESVRTILGKTAQNPAYYETYGITPGTLCLQFDVTVNDEEDSYSAEDESVSALWERGMLLPVAAPDGVICTETFDFSQEAFRSMFEENVFITSPQKEEEPAEEAENPEDVPAEPAEETSEEPAEPVPVFYAVDPDNTTLNVRVRFVLPVTTSDGSVRYAVSSFTEPFACGAQNGLFTDPISMDAPLLDNGEMELLDDGSAVLNYRITPNDTQRETAVWLAYKEAGTLSCEMNLSVNGSEWVPAEYETDAPDTGLLSGCTCTIRIPAEEMTEYAYIRIRSRYAAVTENGRLESPWSESYAFENTPEEILTAPVDTSAVQAFESDTEAPGDLKYVCSLCGFCPAPYGVCIFLWIGAALLIVLFVVLVIALIPRKKACPRCNKKCRQDEKVCPVCGYRFVGMMPEIEDDEEEPKENDEPAPSAEPAAQPAEETPLVSYEPKFPQHTSEIQKVPAAQTEPVQPQKTLSFEATPEFLASLREKMQEAKAGGHPHFSKEEIEYIRMLREKSKKPQHTVSDTKVFEPASAPAESTPAVTESASAEPDTAPVRSASDAETEQKRSAQAQFSAIFHKVSVPESDENSAEPQREAAPAPEKPSSEQKEPAAPASPEGSAMSELENALRALRKSDDRN